LGHRGTHTTHYTGAMFQWGRALGQKAMVRPQSWCVTSVISKTGLVLATDTDEHRYKITSEETSATTSNIEYRNL